MKLGRIAGATDTGRRRRRNEDAYVVKPPLFGIADGMGGAQAGEVASRLAAAVLNEAHGGGTPEEQVVGLIREANRRVFAHANEVADTQGMGTTMTLAVVDEHAGTIVFGHVGDSRAYRFRDGALEQLTEDHSLVQQLIRSGRLSPEEADSHPQKSVITRAVGTEPDVDVDTFAVEAEAGDLYLICSDGLTDMLDAEEIRQAVEGRRGDLDGAARSLLEAANRSGGEDNITVVLFEIAGEPADADDDTRERQPTHASAADDEDTLDELDAVPVIDTAVLPAADGDREAATAEPAGSEDESRRRRWPALLALVLVLALIAALVVWGFVR